MFLFGSAFMNYITLGAFILALLVSVLDVGYLKPTAIVGGTILVSGIAYLAPYAMPVEPAFLYAIAAADFVASFAVAGQNKPFAWALLTPHIAVALMVAADLIR